MSAKRINRAIREAKVSGLASIEQAFTTIAPVIDLLLSAAEDGLSDEQYTALSKLSEAYQRLGTARSALRGIK